MGQLGAAEHQHDEPGEGLKIDRAACLSVVGHARSGVRLRHRIWASLQPIESRITNGAGPPYSPNTPAKCLATQAA